MTYYEYLKSNEGAPERSPSVCDEGVLVVHKSDPECRFKAGDRVKVSDNIRCVQNGHSGTVVGISRHEKHGYPQVTIRLDEPPKNHGEIFTVGDSYVEFL